MNSERLTGKRKWLYLSKNTLSTDRSQLREVQVMDNTTIEVSPGLSCVEVPTLTDSNPQVFPGLEADFPSNESMETAFENKFWLPPHVITEVNESFLSSMS